MKISTKSKNKIQAALDAVNGRATSHTFNADQIVKQVEKLEDILLSMCLPASFRQGATATITSGESVANAYKYARKVNQVKLIRGSSKWFITSIEIIEAWPDESGSHKLVLQQSQHNKIIEVLHRSYSIAGVAA